jgi:hypothetical protein
MTTNSALEAAQQYVNAMDQSIMMLGFRALKGAGFADGWDATTAASVLRTPAQIECLPVGTMIRFQAEHVAVVAVEDGKYGLMADRSGGLIEFGTYQAQSFFGRHLPAVLVAALPTE